MMNRTGRNTVRDVNVRTFSHGGSGILTVYNDDQKKVLRAYDKNMQDNTYYLFFVDNVTDKKDGSGTPVSGYMPRGYNAGFIYDGGSPRTIAHELGHGIAGLEHVFENSNNSGKTANLMDYATGEQLWHFQWDQIQDPSRVWMKWNKDEGEGENVEDKFAVYYLFSPWYADKIVPKNDAVLTDELKTELYALSITKMSDDIKTIILQYKKHPDGNLDKFTNYLKRSSTLATCDDYSQTSYQYDYIQLWYLVPDGDGFKLTQKMLSAKDKYPDQVKPRISNSNQHDWILFTNEWTNFWKEWFAVVMEDHKNGVFSISLSIDANLYIDENFTTGLKESLSQFGDIKHISGNGGAYIEGGIAFDQLNVGIYGNLGVFLNGEIEKVSGMVKKLPTYTTYETVKDMEDYCMAISAGPSVNFSWFWNFDYLPELYGSGHTKTWTIKQFSGNLFYNDKGKVSGLGLSVGPKANIPVGYTSLSSENYGYIMTIEEFLFMLDNCDINNGKTVKPHLDYPYSDGYCKMTKNAYDTYEGKIDLNKFKKLNEKQ